MKTRTIRLTKLDAESAYEWYVGLNMAALHCYACDDVARRLRRFIGPTAAARVRRLVKKNPYTLAVGGKRRGDR